MQELKRDAKKVLSKLVVQTDQSVITTVPARIYIQENYVSKKLAFIGSEISILGFCAIAIDDGSYGVLKVCSMINITPSVISKIKFDDESYYEFSFEAGSKLINNLELIKNDTIVYQIFNHFISRGKIPWFFNYIDLLKLFDTAEYHSGMALDANHSILEMIASAISRNSENKTRYYRQSILNLSEIELNPPTVIRLQSISYGATNTTARIMGNYYDEGLDSALTNPVEKSEKIEQLLRS